MTEVHPWLHFASTWIYLQSYHAALFLMAPISLGFLSCRSFASTWNCYHAALFSTAPVSAGSFMPFHIASCKHVSRKHHAYRLSYHIDSSSTYRHPGMYSRHSKFHRTCPVLPDHKSFVVVQGLDDEFYIDHTHPFGTASASSNAGMIGNTIVDIWMAQGIIKPIFKYEDDLNILQYPVPEGNFIDGNHRCLYDCSMALQCVSCLNIPWHPKKGLFLSRQRPFLSECSGILMHIASRYQ